MTPKPPLHSAKLADQLMAIEVFSELLASTDPQQLGRRLTEQLRELTGARTVALLAHPQAPAPHTLIHVCPERRNELFSTAELGLFCPECTPPPLPLLTAQLPHAHPLREVLQRRKIGSLLRVPLRTRDEIVSTLLLLDLPEPDRIHEVATIVRHLAPVIALALKNAFSQERIAQQALVLQAQTLELEHRVAERTAALEEANRSLTTSRLGALRLMEEAVATRERVEQANASLQREIGERQRAEANLRESEARLTQAMEMTHLAHWEFDAASATLLFNDRFYALYGTTAEREGGYRMPAEIYAREFLLPEEIHLVRDEIMRALDVTSTETSWQLEHRIRRRDGAIRHICVQIIVVKDKAGRTIGTRGANQDITERKQAGEALRDSEARYRETIEFAVDGILRCAPTGEIIDANSQMLKLTGRPLDQLLGRRIAVLFEPIELKARPLQFDVLAIGQIVVNERNLLRPDGTKLPVEMRSKRMPDTSFQTIFRDITERKAAETALRESEEKFSKVFHAAPAWIGITDLVDATYVDINDEALRLSGFTRAEVIGRTSAELGWLSPETRARLAQNVQEHGRVTGLEMTLHDKAGRPHSGWLSSELIAIGGRPCLLTIIVDITDRKHAEDTLAWEAALVENSSDVCAIKDLDLRVRAVNKAFLASAGVATAAEVLGKTDVEIFQRQGNAANIEGYMADDRRAQTLPAGEYISRLETMVRPDGTEQILLTRKFPVFNPSGQLIATANISSDVTEHQRLEEALHRNEQRYRLLFSSNVAGVALHEILCDAAGCPCDYRFIEVNPAFERLIGLPAANLVGHTVLEMMPQTEPVWIERYGLVALTGEATHFEQYSAVLNRHYEVSAYCPQPGQFAVLVLDITERKRAEDALHESLREKEALLKEVHHRVKNNLQVISSLLRLEAARVADPATRSVLRDMQNRIRTMALLHESLYRSGNLAEVDMKAYLETLCQQLFRAATARSSGLVALQMAVAPLRIELNRTVPCGLIVNELVSNCLKHAFPGERGGRVRVELQPTAVPDEWSLCVSDDGVGLPPGFTLENLPSLGLQLVSDLSRQLQGRLEITPGMETLPLDPEAIAPRHGSAFTVYFKALPPEPRPTP